LKTKDLDAVLDAATKCGSVPGVVAAVTDRSGVLYRCASGVADVATGAPMRTDAVFRIASMTKLLTSIAVLKLHERSLVDLDAPFARYFPGFRQPPVLRSFDFATRSFAVSPAATAVTVRQLLTHTSGYGYWFLNRELFELMGAEPEYYNPPFLMSEPGTRFHYGIGTDVLGQLVQPVTGLALPAFLAAELFEPLGMRDTGYALPADPGRLAAVHAVANGSLGAQRRETQGEAPRGGGGLYSTANDYLALLRMLLNDGAVGDRRCLAETTVRMLASDQVSPLRVDRQTTAAPARTADFEFMDGSQTFGLGVLIETRARANGRTAGSYGWAGILNTYFWVDPAAGIGAVLCMQMTPFCAPACVALCRDFETALYALLRE
jgi:CubicO group peptidase (beta-lactamase class C family)